MRTVRGTALKKLIWNKERTLAEEKAKFRRKRSEHTKHEVIVIANECNFQEVRPQLEIRIHVILTRYFDERAASCFFQLDKS